MSGIEVIGLIISVAQVVAKIVSVYGSARNAPREVARLRRLLADLEDNRDLLLTASDHDREALADMINRSRDLLEENAPHPSNGTRIRNFLWPAQAEVQLKSHNDDIHQELSRLYNRNFLRGSQSVQSQFGVTPSLGSPTLAASTTPHSSSIRRFESPRKPSVAVIDLPTTIVLQRENGTTLGKAMHFDRLSIMERDETIRTIEYECLNPTQDSLKRITHRIPRGTVRFEDNSLSDCTVAFLDPHDITIESAEGYRIHRIYAEYRFDTNEEREMFLLKVRERDLIDRFFVQTILLDNGKIVTQAKVVRIWKKTYDLYTSNGAQSIAPREKVTVSFMGRDQKQFELALGDYKRSPKQDGPSNNRVTITSLADSSSMVFQFEPRPKPRQASFSKWLGHSSPVRTPQTGDAEKFKARFMEYHPATSTFMPLPSPAISIRSPSFPIQEIIDNSRPGAATFSASSDNRFESVNWKDTGVASGSFRAVSSSSSCSSRHDLTGELSTSPGTVSLEFAKEIERSFSWSQEYDAAEPGNTPHVRS